MSSEEKTSVTPRRSLFPKSYSKKESKKEKFVTFSPYARCLKLEPQNLSEDERACLWWQKNDYEDFARLGKIISKAMLEGGSEVWLRSKCTPFCASPTSSCSVSEYGNAATVPTTTRDDTMVESHSSSTRANPPLHLHNHVSETEPQEFYEMQGKWWHKFGHSRRGLEHIASNSEGRQRHANARYAIRSVLEEQQRQEMFLPKGYFDVDKFRSVYLKQTHWARLLALAAGESDTDAVQTNFDESRRKPREHYLKKHFDNNIDNAATNNDVDIPNFMKTIVSTARPTKKLNLDANTISQICFRNSQIDPRSDNSKLKGHNNKKKNKVTGKTQLSSKPAAPESPSSPDEEGKAKETVVNDDASTSTEDSSTSNLAKMAAGWGGDESSSQEDMSFVLIGMGIAEKPNITVG